MVADPGTARPLPGAARVLGDLAEHFGLMAVVSGRPASFLYEHLGGGNHSANLRLVGLYGLEWVGPSGGVETTLEAQSWRGVVAEAADRAESKAPAGARIERKGLTVTLHWRENPGHEAWAVRQAARLSEETGLAVHPAKMSVELRPPIQLDKGTVLVRLAEGFATLVYLGDDVGDLPAFAALDGLARGGVGTVKVAVHGPDSPKAVLDAADLVLSNPEEVLSLFQELAEASSRP